MGSGSDLQMQQIACQELQKKDDVFYGWLRGKTVLHKWGEAVDQKINRPGFAKQITSLISWNRFYVVINDGYFLIYKGETSKKPATVIDLCGFQRVEREENLKIKDVPWPFKVSSEINNKVMYYGAMSEPDLKKWIEAVTKGIDDAKQSGRTPVIYEKKDTFPKPKKEKPLPRPPSIPPVAGDDNEDDDLQDEDYDYIPDPIEEMQPRKQPAAPHVTLPPLPAVTSTSSGRGGEVEYEMSSPKGLHQPAERKISRQDISVPPAPVQNNFEKARANLNKVPPQVPGGVKPQPAAGLKKPAVPTPSAKPPLPGKTNIQPTLAKKPVPQVPVGEKSHANEDDDDVEYEIGQTDDGLVKEATWNGLSEESTELMKSIKEEGVFMLRESTTGNGDQTLQVLSGGAVRKYRILQEEKKFRMAGGNAFDTMEELLTFYQKNSIPNHSTKLTKPYSKI